MVNPEQVTVTVKPELTMEQADVLRQLLNMGLEGSATALEVIPSVDAKVRLVERRAHLMDILDELQAATYRAKIELET